MSPAPTLQDYGGMLQYVKWAHRERGESEGGCAEEFYTDPACQRMFRHWAAALLQRVNTLTGVAYRQG